jgi:hypothetical protein
MNHSTSTDLFGMEYANVQRNREAAIKALAEMPVKPIRIMVPMDYSAKNLTPESVKEFRQRECQATREKLALREKCIAILRELGPQTTAEMGRLLRVSSRAVALSLDDVQHIKKETIHERSRKKAGAYVDGIRWALPGVFAAKAAG